MRGGTEKKEEEKEKEEEKIPHMCESIGHRPLRGRCPKRIDVDNQKISESILQFKIVVKLVSYDKSIFCINSIF